MNIVYSVNKLSEDGKSFIKVADTTLKEHKLPYAYALTTATAGGVMNAHKVMLVIEVSKIERQNFD